MSEPVVDDQSGEEPIEQADDLAAAAADEVEVPAIAPEPVTAGGQPEESTAQRVEPEGPKSGSEEAATPVPEEVTEPEVVAAGFAMERPRLPAWPFVAYLVAWLAFAAIVVWQLAEVPRDMAVYEAAIYPLTLLAGVALTLCGPIVILAAWLIGRADAGARTGLFASSFLRGAAVTLVGVVLWWAALIIVDYLRFGRLI